ncbi:MAG: outer membrane beta-barrel protein [Chitinophagales bacterium]|nr:outer membrane beta-barrel protein [Chitinophagales bacterium]
MAKILDLRKNVTGCQADILASNTYFCGMRHKALLIILPILFLRIGAWGQTSKGPGVLSARIIADSTGQPLAGASIILQQKGTTISFSQVSDGTGEFTLTGIPYGYYTLKISFTGLNSYILDSLHFRSDRSDFNLNDIRLKNAGPKVMEEVVIHVEKPLIETKEGNITFNASESALSAGSSASELLTNVPLVTKDPDGKILVKGKEPRILIDDKPVSLNLQQLQDLLESMPGSSIEKIEVLTNPPPQYANEQGGVINIVTKKGRIGKSGRVTLFAGSRGEAGLNASYSYRRKGLAINLNSGISYNRYRGEGNSQRQNIYTDSTNFFNTTNAYINRSTRPNFRGTVDYDINTRQSLNLTLNFNHNHFDNDNETAYRNINRFDSLYKLSIRSIQSLGENTNPSGSATWLIRKKDGGSFKLHGGLSFSRNNNDRDFFQEYLNPDFTPTGSDSTQEMINDTRIRNLNVSALYVEPLVNKKTYLSFSMGMNRSANHVVIDASYLRQPDGQSVKLDQLSNDFWFYQTVSSLMASVRHLITPDISFTMGATLDRTDILFRLLRDNKRVGNDYHSLLPFANFNRTWKDKLNLTLAYRRTIRRPGVNELNPTIDFSDPYNIRFGNEKLEASTADNFDLVVGRTRTKYFFNLGIGYNQVRKIFSQVRTLLEDGKTQLTWENLSGRKEYEMSSWNGLHFSKKFRLNFSATYTYSVYSAFDRDVRKFRNGGSFTSNASANYSPRDILTFTSSIAFNRFGNPQGYASWRVGTNLGLQAKLLSKKLILSVSTTDPFRQQIVRRYTYGPNFNLVSENMTVTRNFRVTVGYNFSKTITRIPAALTSSL